MGQKSCIALAILMQVLLHSASAHAECKAKFINPVTDVCWSCIFPIKIGGVTVFDSDQPDTQDNVSGPICACKGPYGIPSPGISVSFWEPFRIIESVMDPFCFPSLGFELSNPLGGAGELRGTVQGQGAKDAMTMYAAQAHEIIFPVWGLLELLTDLPCISNELFDVAYFTELDPLWQSDFRSLILNPEALVFGNPLLQLACMADAVSAANGTPNNSLFWCMGQWGSAYPLTGRISTSNMLTGAAGTAARLIYKLNRELLMCDSNAGNGCGCVRTPIWQKANYRLQIARPKRNTGSAIRIGEPTPLWEPNQLSGSAGDENFAFVVFRKNSCCVTFF